MSFVETYSFQFILHLFVESTCRHLDVQIKFSVDIKLEFGIKHTFIAESALEKDSNTLHITVEIARIHQCWSYPDKCFRPPQSYLLFSIWMRCGYHLWEINQNGVTIGLDQDIEFVEITVDKTILRQTYNKLHQL